MLMDTAADDSAAVSSTNVCTFVQALDWLNVKIKCWISRQVRSAIHPCLNCTSQWHSNGYVIDILVQIDKQANELNWKNHPVAYRIYPGDGLYISVTSGVICLDNIVLSQYYVPYVHSAYQHCPTKKGLMLILDEWANLIALIPYINAYISRFGKCKLLHLQRQLPRSIMLTLFGRNYIDSTYAYCKCMHAMFWL